MSRGNIKDEAGGEAVGICEDKNPYDQLQSVRTELNLVKFSEDIEDDLLESSLEEYQSVPSG